jgi:hypothetical protein
VRVLSPNLCFVPNRHRLQLTVPEVFEAACSTVGNPSRLGWLRSPDYDIWVSQSQVKSWDTYAHLVFHSGFGSRLCDLARPAPHREPKLRPTDAPGTFDTTLSLCLLRTLGDLVVGIRGGPQSIVDTNPSGSAEETRRW